MHNSYLILSVIHVLNQKCIIRSVKILVAFLEYIFRPLHRIQAHPHFHTSRLIFHKVFTNPTKLERITANKILYPHKRHSAILRFACKEGVTSKIISLALDIKANALIYKTRTLTALDGDVSRKD